MKGRKFYVDVMQDSAEVTGSFIPCIVKIDDQTIKFAVDCGMYQEKGYEEQNQNFPVIPENVEFVILTHNHVDHNGRLPYLVREGFKGRILTTEVTKRILGRALRDNAKVISDTSKRKNKQALYDTQDVSNTMALVEGYGYNYPVRVNDNITVTFIPNGHLIGAACVLVQIHCPGESKDINLFFTGDYNSKNMFFKVPPVRKWITELPLTIVTESTYGNMESSQIQKCFRKNILQALKQKKTIIIPVFSLGRAQEILYVLREMKHKYPSYFNEVPIYYDGKLSFYYTKKYFELMDEGLVHFYFHKKAFIPEDMKYVEIDEGACRDDIVKDWKCKIIVTTSGMGSYGPAQTYIPAFIGKPNALIHFTGYCAEGTFGHTLKAAPQGSIVEIGGSKTIKRAEVEYTNEFTAHAKADELLKFLKKFKNPQFIMVNHGESQTKDIFADRILQEVGVENVGILGREYFYRVDQNGFVKSLTSKFL